MLRKEEVDFSYSGGEADDFDLIFTIGVKELADFGQWQNQLTRLANNKKTVVINNKPINLSFGTLKIISEENRSISEMVTLLLARLNLPVDGEIAENLLMGIKDKTTNFSQATADSFEAASICVRRKTLVDLTQNNGRSFASPLPTSPVSRSKAPADWLKPKIFRSSNPTNVFNNNKGTIL